MTTSEGGGAQAPGVDPQIQAFLGQAMAAAFEARIPAAEEYLDSIAEEARAEARRAAPNPEPVLALLDHTRQLSTR